MKLLFENWRRFESALTEQSAFGPSLGAGSAARKDRDWQRLAAQDPDEALRQRRIEKERMEGCQVGNSCVGKFSFLCKEVERRRYTSSIMDNETFKVIGIILLDGLARVI